MTHFRLAILVCACALGCSGTDDGDPADPGQTADPAATAVTRETADPAKTVVPGETAAPGLPGLEAPPDVAAVPGDAQRTPSGLASRRLVAGDGTHSPMPTDRVRVQYSGWQTNGTRFDSSVARGKPAEFPLNGVIAGWTEGLQLMVEGEERRFWIPEELAYQGRQAPYGMLVFDVQLLAILP
jgi:hypothetical protein